MRDLVLRCAPGLALWAVFPPPWDPTPWSAPGRAQVPVGLLPRSPLYSTLGPPGGSACRRVLLAGHEGCLIVCPSLEQAVRARRPLTVGAACGPGPSVCVPCRAQCDPVLRTRRMRLRGPSPAPRPNLLQAGVVGVAGGRPLMGCLTAS